jgi:hypothetical protein
MTSVTGSSIGGFTQIALATRDTGTHSQSIWAKFASSPLTSETITANITTSTFITMDAFGVSGTGQVSTVFDGGPVIQNGPGITDPISITTSLASTMVIATFGLSAGPGNSAGSGFTAIGGATDWSVTEYQVLSSATTVTAALGTPNVSNGACAVAIAGGGIIINLSSIQQRVMM